MSPAQRILLAGGGPAAIETALALRELAGDRVDLALIAPEQDMIVRAYEVLAPFQEGRERRYPLARVAADLHAELIRDTLAGVEPSERSVSLQSGADRGYDALVIAVGARFLDTVGGAIPFRGARDAARLRSLLMESHAGAHRSVAFIVPGGHSWPLPLYELALQTSAWLTERGVTGMPLTIVTTEHKPLSEFGAAASSEVAAILDAHGVRFVTGHAVRQEPGRLLLAGGAELDADLSVALIRLGGPQIPGLPSDAEGFLAVDELGRVIGVQRIYAAGDATSFPIKQGGLATQQADVIAAGLASQAGVAAEVQPFRPVLRAVLYGGRETRYLEAELGAGREPTSRASAEPLWPESSKLVGRYLAPYLDRLAAS